MALSESVAEQGSKNQEWRSTEFTQPKGFPLYKYFRSTTKPITHKIINTSAKDRKPSLLSEFVLTGSSDSQSSYHAPLFTRNAEITQITFQLTVDLKGKHALPRLGSALLPTCSEGCASPASYSPSYLIIQCLREELSEIRPRVKCYIRRLYRF